MQVTKWITYITAGLTTLLGIFGIICWHIGTEDLLMLPNCNWPMPYQASISAFLSGLILFSMTRIKSYGLTRLFGLVLLINIFFAFNYLFYKDDFGFTNFLISTFHFPEAKYSHMVQMGIISYGLIGLYALVWRTKKRNRWESNACLFISLLIFFLGTLFVLTYFLPIKLVVGWTVVFPIQCFSAISIWFAGCGLICLSLYWDSYFLIGITKTKAVLVTICLTFFAILISMGLKAEKDEFVGKLMNDQVVRIQKIIEVEFAQSLELLKGMGSVIDKEKEIVGSDWQLDTKSWIQANPAITTFVWLDKDFKEIFNVSNVSVNLSASILEKIKKKAKKDQTYTTLLPSQNDHNTLIMSYPLYWNNDFQGSIVEAFNADLYFHNLFLHEDFVIIIESNHKTIAGINTEDLKPVIRWKSKAVVSIDDLVLNLTIYPTEVFVAVHVNDTYIYIVLFGGFCVALSLGALLYQWQQSRSRLFDLQKLEMERSFTLSSADIGRWVFDIEKKTFEFDSYSLFLYGRESSDHLLSFEQFFNIILEEDREVAKETFKKSLLSLAPIDAMFKVVWSDKSIHFILCKGQVVYDENMKPKRFTGINWDVSLLVQSKQLLGASESITKTFGELQSLSVSVSKVIQILHHALGWDVLIIWYKDKEGSLFKCLETATAAGVEATEFIEKSKELGKQGRLTFLDRVWSTFGPVWLKDFVEDPSFIRREAAIKENIHGALAFPIFEKGVLTGVVELFKKKPFIGEMTDQYANFIMTVGIEVGQFIQRSEAQNQLRRLTSVITFSAAGIFHTDPNGIVLSWNEGAESIYGWTYEDMVGQSITKIYPEERLAEFDMIMSRLRNGKHLEHFKSERIHKDGRRIWVENTISIILGPKQEVEGYSVISLNITEQQETAKRLRKSEEKFRDFVETIEEWIWEIDKNGTFTYSNPYIRQILGYSEQEIIGKNIFMLMPEERRQNAESDIQIFFKRKKGWASHILIWRHKNGTLRSLESNAEPIFDEANQFAGLRGADRDITERINIEKSKNEFISTFSHELRTPLTSIYAALVLLQDEKELSEESIELLGIAERNCNRLIALINDILDSEKIQLGRLVINSVITSITKITREAIKTAVLSAEQFQVNIEESGEFPEVCVFADPGRLMQVILNLLSNAIKFSQPHSVVSVSMTIEEENVKVSVQDRGSGIPKAFYPHIFEKFAKYDKGDTTAAGGTGLGLSISKSIIHQLGGTIGFTSEEGEGSTFFFTLPIKDQ